jgi:hypothetical protein
MRLSVGGAPSSASLNGIVVGMNFAVGYTIVAGLALAAEAGVWGGAATLEGDAPGSVSTSTSQSYEHFGLLADWYVDPKQGWHLQAGVGFAGITPSSDIQVGPVLTAPNTYTTISVGSQSGMLVGFGAGWEGFVSDRWSAGVLLRLDAAWGSDNSQGVQTSASLVVPSVRLTFTFNG